MTISDFLRRATKQLEAADIATARLDCLVLLEDILNTNRTHVLAHPELPLTSEQQKHLELCIKRRVKHEPLAYIRNKTEFYGREFYIDANVLEPRPESETMVDILKQLPLPEQSNTIVDIGTGSGALAITAKLEMPTAKVVATDIDATCLVVAARNARNLGANIQFLQGNLLNALTTNSPHSATVLLCNLPYVPDNFPINTAAAYEPQAAIFGGPDGLDLYRQLFQQIIVSATFPTYILAESLPQQHDALAGIAQTSGFSLQKTEDFIQLFRRGSGNSAS